MAQITERLYKITVDASQAARATSQLAKNTRQIDAGFSRAGKEVQKANVGYRSLSYQLQNTSYQLSDFIVQVQGGVAPLRAFSQQAPQLLAGFGSLGAAIGVVSALLPSLFIAMNKGKDVTKTLSNQISDLDSATTNYTDALTAYIENANSYTQATLAMSAASRELARNNVAEAFAPPEASGWTIILDVLKNGAVSAANGIKDAASAATEFLVNIDPNIKAAYESLIKEEQLRLDAMNQWKIDLQKALSFDASNMTIAQSIIQEYRALQPIVDAVREQLGYVPKELQELFDASAAGYRRIQTLTRELANELDAIGKPAGLVDLQAGVQKYFIALQEGIITQREFNDLANNKWKEYQNSAGSTLNKVADQIDNVGSTLTSSIIGGLEQGKIAFDDFGKSVLKSLANVVLNDIFQQFFQVISGSIRGAVGGAGLSAVPIPVTTRSTRIRAFASPATAQPQQTRAVGAISPPTYGYTGASRRGSSPVAVTVNNNAQAQVGVSERQGPNGLEIEIAVESLVNQKIANGAFDQSMNGAYGLRRRAY